jgi:hypothetical protein
LQGRQLVIWNSTVRRCPWLSSFDVHLALVWTRLTYKSEMQGLGVGELREYRILSSQLGFDPSARARPAPKSDGDEKEAKIEPDIFSLFGRPGLFNDG